MGEEIPLTKTEIWYNSSMTDGNGFWKVCKAHIVDLNGTVFVPKSEPEATLLELTLV